MISGTTKVFPVIGYPVEQVKAPEILNQFFDRADIDAVVVPLAVAPRHFISTTQALFRGSNVTGALVTIPHKRAALELLDDCSVGVKVAGACNAVVKRPDGSLFGEIFDGIAFVSCLRKAGYNFTSGRVLMIGSGGVGAAIAAALLDTGVKQLGLYDIYPDSAANLIARLQGFFPDAELFPASIDPQGFDLVVNASPLGMSPDDPLPVDVARLAPTTRVAEVVMKLEKTPLLLEAERLGCPIQLGREMFLAQKPLYIDFFGLASSEHAFVSGCDSIAVSSPSAAISL